MRLALELIGPPQLRLEDVPVTTSRRAVVALLAYLAVSEIDHPQQRHTRESLSALLWSDYDQSKALTNLRHTLWEVTQSLGDGWILADHETLSLNPAADLTLDVKEFQSLWMEASQESEPGPRISMLVAAIRLYRGDFLAGFSLKNAAGFNEWIVLKSEELRGRMTAALHLLVEDYAASGEAEAAIPHAQRLISMAPLNEAAHRQLMQLYALTDQQPAAIQQYQTLEKLLRQELNLDPQPETRELYRKLRKREIKPVEPETSAPKHNLPVQLTTFVGHEKERDEIAGLLAQNRLVTLMGTGGIGKTRLALQTGRSLLDDYPDGVWFVPLESLVDEKMLVPTVASYLGISKLPDQAILDTLIYTLRERRMLLILDNCEHLLEACSQLAETLLKNCPNVKVLATSRDSLRLEGEASYHVPALAAPKDSDRPSVNELANYESIRLFAERAALVFSGFEVTKENAKAMIEICKRLDGIPLAIELAAAQVDLFKVEEILEQLNRSFDLLVSPQRSIAQRHQTLRASIEWGWNLLTDSEQIFMSRLAVFAGGWTLPAAQAVCEDKSLELISALVRKSLVVVHQDTARETRYDFHEMIRNYALEKLVQAGEEELVRDRHLEYFLELSRQFEPALHGSDQLAWLERLYVERDNFRAALQWAAKMHVEAGLYLSGRLRTFWENYALGGEKRWLLMI
jgi:predicted ATPase/DNA-binding SARP family transcriptional activator